MGTLGGSGNGNKGELARLNGSSVNGPKVRTQLRMATAGDNAEILTEIRAIVKGQLIRLKAQGVAAPFTAAQAGILHRLAQTYAILDSHTEKEHRKYDFAALSEEQLSQLATSARAIIGEGNDE